MTALCIHGRMHKEDCPICREPKACIDEHWQRIGELEARIVELEADLILETRCAMTWQIRCEAHRQAAEYAELGAKASEQREARLRTQMEDARVLLTRATEYRRWLLVEEAQAGIEAALTKGE